MPDPVALGVVYAAMFALHPTWGAVIGSYRVTLVPDRLQGRVQSAMLILSLGAVPVGSLAVGYLLERIGGMATILVLASVMLPVGIAPAVSRSAWTPPALSTAARTDALSPDG